MSYGVSVSPSTITKGGKTVATVVLPEVEDVVHDVEVVRRGTLDRVASATVTVHSEQLTVGVESDESTDYFLRADGLEVVQTGDREFEIRA